MSKRDLLLEEVNSFSVQEFADFLKINGLNEFEQVVTIKSIDGHTFLNLAEFEIKSWRPIVNVYQAQVFWTFLSKLRQHPEAFSFIEKQSKVNISSEKNNEEDLTVWRSKSFINSLQEAVKGFRQRCGEEKQPLLGNNQGERSRILAPPRPAIYKKESQLNKVSSEEELDSDGIYESPDYEEKEVNIRTQDYRRRPPLSPPSPLPKFKLPEKPTFSKPQQVDQLLYEDVDAKPKATRPKIPQAKPSKPFRFEEHYKQRDSKPTSGSANSNIQNNPLPPIPTVPTNFTKTISSQLKPPERLNLIPRPPKALPKVEIEKLPDRSQAVAATTMEQESYYRYTDKKGADDLLSEFSDGTYLIRPSRTHYGALCVKKGDKVYQFGIQKVEGNLLEITSDGLDLKFNSLKEMITHFESNPITSRNKQKEIITMYLSQTLPPDRT